MIRLVILCLLCAGCIPVTVRPERDDAGKPIAIPVTAAGSVQQADGTRADLVPLYDVSDQEPSPPPSFDWQSLLAIAIAALTGGAGVAVPLLRGKGQAMTALKLVTGLVDRVAAAPDDVAVADEKLRAMQEQEEAGVRNLIQRVRGKAT
jgi:hypothetical protein